MSDRNFDLPLCAFLHNLFQVDSAYVCLKPWIGHFFAGTFITDASLWAMEFCANA